MFFFFSTLHLFLPLSRAVRCFYCTSMLNSQVQDEAKNAMKNLLYNIPPTHELCALPEDVEFRIIPTVECGEDQCVRIQAFEDKLHLVMRGCESSLAKIGRLNGSCSASSPSVCACDSELCNASARLLPKKHLFVASLVLLRVINVL